MVHDNRKRAQDMEKAHRISRYIALQPQKNAGYGKSTQDLLIVRRISQYGTLQALKYAGSDSK